MLVTSPLHAQSYSAVCVLHYQNLQSFVHPGFTCTKSYSIVGVHSRRILHKQMPSWSRSAPSSYTCCHACAESSIAANSCQWCAYASCYSTKGEASSCIAGHTHSVTASLQQQAQHCTSIRICMTYADNTQRL
jgi:hypothetical protein